MWDLLSQEKLNRAAEIAAAEREAEKAKIAAALTALRAPKPDPTDPEYNGV